MKRQYYTALRKDNHQEVRGSLLYDFEQDCWRIVTGFFDVEPPIENDQFGVNAPEILFDSIEEEE